MLGYRLENDVACVFKEGPNVIALVIGGDREEGYFKSSDSVSLSRKPEFMWILSRSLLECSLLRAQKTSPK